MAHEIPTIDFSGPGSAHAIGAAAETYGFLTLVGHGIPPAVILDTFHAAARFFALPAGEKARYRETGTSDRGYHPIFDVVDPYSGRPSAQEGFTMGHPFPPADPALAALPFYRPTPWPPLPGFRAALERSYLALFDLGREVLRAMAVHLGGPAGFFDPALVDTYSHLKLNHYPPQETIAHIAEEGVFAHADESLITLLIQDANGGLDVRGPDGRWIPVFPDPGAVIINVGKLLTHWSGGRYTAALHRVVNRSGRERYSMPVFMHPSFHTRIDPRDLVGDLVGDLMGDPGGEAPGFPPIVAGEHAFEGLKKPRKSWNEADQRAD